VGTSYGGLGLAALAVLDTALAWCAKTGRHASAVLAARFAGVPSLGDLTAVDRAAVPPYQRHGQNRARHHPSPDRAARAHTGPHTGRTRPCAAGEPGGPGARAMRSAQRT
jgi:hypothetical protein